MYREKQLTRGQNECAAKCLQCFLLCAIALGQNAHRDASTEESPGTVLRFDVNLVQLDAVVTDRKNDHVATLTPADFDVVQDGTPQKITHFSYVSRIANRQHEDASQSVVIVFDDRDMKFPDFVYAKKRSTGFYRGRPNQA